MPAPRTQWSASLHQTFRILPAPAATLPIFLSSHGKTATEILAKLPYASARSASGGTSPDAKRFRDPKGVYQAVGLLYEGNDGRLVVTEFGTATRRWLSDISSANVGVLGRHAAYALATCQLRNPTGAKGREYSSSVEVFPFKFIWRAMLALEDKISSDELNRSMFHVTDEQSLDKAINEMAMHRENPHEHELGEEVVTGDKKNDRIIPWMSLASFGWALITDKSESPSRNFYTIRPEAKRILIEAAQIQDRHKDFTDVSTYVEHISAAACLPKDLR